MNIGIFDPDGKNNNPLNDMPYSDEYKNLSKMWSTRLVIILEDLLRMPHTF